MGLWTAMNSHSAPYQGSVLMGKKASFRHKESREVDWTSGHCLHGEPCRLCCGILALFRDLG